MAGKLANGHGGMTSRGATVTLRSAGRFSIDQLDLALDIKLCARNK